MLTDDLKETIRGAYNAVLAARGLVPRWGQRQMIAEIARTLGRIPEPGESSAEGPAICIVEAGTGTGKTIAYALAAIPVARARGKRLVVATATVALQEQFINKDLPDIHTSSGLEFSVALAKGRRRYVCLSKLDRLLGQGGDAPATIPLYPDEMPAEDVQNARPVYEAMVEALARGDWDGDRDGWSGHADDAIWSSVTTDHNQCTGRRCPNVGQCSFFRARDELESADIIVSNHDLVLSDLALGGGAILPPPEDSIYIFDEGHHLPDKALNHFSSFCRLHSTRQWLQDSGKSLAQAIPSLAQMTGLERVVAGIPGAMSELVQSLQVLEEQLADLSSGEAKGTGRDNDRWRFANGHVPKALQSLAGGLAAGFGKLASTLARIEARLEDAVEEGDSGFDRSEVEDWHLAVSGMRGRCESALALWQDYAVSTDDEEPPRARWVNRVAIAGQEGYELCCSPILANEILAEHLWSRAAGVVLTSATITALGRFDRFIQRSGVPAEAVFKVVASPFDYASAIFAVPAMQSDAGNAEAHTAELVTLLPQLLVDSEAALVLFGSRRQMQAVVAGIAGGLGERLLVQDQHSKQEILRRHRDAVDAGRGSVIFGLASFAEGVDLPGDYCRHVVIAKIPFAVPDSPLEAALAEWIDSRGGNAFMEISVPDAALRLVQASGRLLRTEKDTGRVTLCDRRIVSRRYGREILDSLPPFRREIVGAGTERGGHR
ncbi:MAG: ATP-dependent DNA helicase DinG [Chromatocurvus sp.]